MNLSAVHQERMTDIHMHLIPGVDDGAEDMTMALLMLLHAQEQGITGIIATPHSSAFENPEKVQSRYQQLCIQAAQAFPEMKICLGCEVYCNPDRMKDTLSALKHGLYPTMNNTNYVLIEFSQWIMTDKTEPCVRAIRKAGFIPIIAHMERYKYLCGNMDLAKRFREQGVLIQVNAYSLSDETDDSIRNWARQLVREKMVDFLGTDAHRTYHRPVSAEHGLNWLYDNTDWDYADAIAWKNARTRLLDGQ